MRLAARLERAGGNGGFDTVARIAFADGGERLVVRYASSVARATGRSVLAAATAQQEALEGYRGHGVLTYVLLEGLNGAAAPATEPITTSALASYALDRVPAISAKQFGAEQHPVFSVVGRDIVLVRRKQR